MASFPRPEVKQPGYPVPPSSGPTAIELAIAAIEARHAEEIVQIRKEEREAIESAAKDVADLETRQEEMIKQAVKAAYEDAARVVASWVGVLRGDDAIRVLREKAEKL